MSLYLNILHPSQQPQYSPFHETTRMEEKTKETHTTRGPIILCVVWAHCSSSFPSIVAWCRSCWWWIHIYYDLVKRMTNKKEKKQTYQGGPNDTSFGPTARHLSPPSRHGVRGHGGGSYIYDLVKRITNEKEKNKHIKGAQTTRRLGPLLVIFPLCPDMASVVMVAAISMT